MIKKRSVIFLYLVLLIYSVLLIFSGKVAAQGECAPGECTTCRGSCCCDLPCGADQACWGYGCGCWTCGCQSGIEQTCCDDSGHWATVCCGGGCFTGETEVDTKSQDSSIKTQKISELKEGDIVESFNPETGEIKEGTVSDVTKLMREGYYILETESGKQVKVTGEHPFLALKSENNQESINQNSTSQDSNLREKISNILSQTLTYKVITGLQARISEILK